MHGSARLADQTARFDAVLSVLPTGAICLAALSASSIWIPVYAGIFRVTPAVMGLVGSVQLVMSAVVMLLLAPWLMERFQPRSLMLGGLAALLTAEILTSLLHPGLALFVVLRVVEGISVGLATAGTGLIASLTRNPTRTFGLLQLCQTILVTTLFASASIILWHFGMPGLFMAVAAGALLALPCALRTPLIEKVAGGARARADGLAIAAFPALGFAAIATIFLVNIAVSTHMADFGMRVGISVSQASLVLAASYGLGIVASSLVTVLAGRVPVWLILSVAGVCVSFGLFGIAQAHTPAALMIAACAQLFGNNLAVPPIIAVVSASDNTGRAASSAQAAIMTGIACGPVTGGMIEYYISAQAVPLIFMVPTLLALFAGGVLALGQAHRALPAQ